MKHLFLYLLFGVCFGGNTLCAQYDAPRPMKANAKIVPLRLVAAAKTRVEYERLIPDESPIDLYVKDIQGDLNRFIGYWVGTNPATGALYEILFNKHERLYINENLEDVSAIFADRLGGYYGIDLAHLGGRFFTRTVYHKGTHYVVDPQSKLPICKFYCKDGELSEVGDIYLYEMQEGQADLEFIPINLFAVSKGSFKNPDPSTHPFPPRPARIKMERRSASSIPFSQVKATQETAKSEESLLLERLQMLLRYYAWDSRLVGQRDAQGAKDIVLSRGSLECLDANAGSYQTKPGVRLGLFRPNSLGALYKEMELRLDIGFSSSSKDAISVATLLRGLTHVSILLKLEYIGLSRPEVRAYLEKSHYCGDDFVQLFDYYASVLGVSPLDLAREYIRDVTPIIRRVLPELSAPDILLWSELQGGRAWEMLPASERSQIASYLSTLGL